MPSPDGCLFAQQVPWVLLSLPAGAWADRVDRRRLLVGVNLARAGLAAALAAAVATGRLSLALIYLVVFAVGTAEVVADTSSSSLVPALVDDDDLPRANASLVGVFMVGNQFAGPPVGAWAFAVAAALPFGLEAAGFVVAALLLSRITPGAASSGTGATRRRGWMGADVREGLAWVRTSPTIRLLAIVLTVMNVTFMAAFAVWVLYAQQRLGLSEQGFGILLTASAVGGLVGSVVTGRLTDRFGPAALLRVGLLTETAVHVVLAVTRSPWVAGMTMVAFGLHAAVWGAVVATIRQRLVPAHLLGRVTSVYQLLTMGGAAMGALAGGWLARPFGLTGPFWVAAGVNVALIVVAWPRINPTTMAGERPVRHDSTGDAEQP